MGFSLSSLLDPLDLSGQGAAAGALETSQVNADLLRGFSDASQANLQPFLDVSNRQLPALEASATPEGFFNDANALRPLASELAAPIVADRTRDLTSQLGSTGLTRSGFAGTAAADIQEDADLSMLLQLQTMLQGRRQRVAGQGSATGGNLARLGASSAEQLGSVQSQGILSAAQATAAGQQNLLSLAGLGANFANTGGGVDIVQPNLSAPNPDGSFNITPQR